MLISSQHFRLQASIHHTKPSPRTNAPCYFPTLHRKPNTTFKINPNTSIFRPHSSCNSQKNQFQSVVVNQDMTQESTVVVKPENNDNNFWGAVGLIVGTAVGPGMLGLPAAASRAGPVPSTVAIVLSWVYVISSIILVAELSFAAMEESGSREVSFTALATSAFGPDFGAFVAVIYAALSFSLLIACVSGTGTLIVQQFPSLCPLVANALAPCLVGIVLGFFPFAAIDVANRLLCGVMLCSITALVLIGISVGRSNLLGSLAFACWRPEAILPAIPVTVLTLGFHVITPFVCMIVGHSIYDARKAVLYGGAVPLAMVLFWNLVVLVLAGPGGNAYSDPIKLLLSVNASALPAVQGFAFTALLTSLIGSVSFPKQLLDTKNLIVERFDKRLVKYPNAAVFPHATQRKFMASNGSGLVGFATYSMGKRGTSGRVSFTVSGPGVISKRLEMHANCNRDTNGCSQSSNVSDKKIDVVMWLVLVLPIFIASFFRAAFAKALDFAGIYANWFLFGVLPPAMAWIH